MEIGTLIFIAAAAIAGILIGLTVGYLSAKGKSIGAEGRAAKFETMASAYKTQLGEKDSEITRLNDRISQDQQNLLDSRSAKTRAETRLSEIGNDLSEIREQLNTKDLECTAYRDAHFAAEKRSIELAATNKAIIGQLNEQRVWLAEAEEKLRDAFASLSSEALRRNNTSFIELANEKLGEKAAESAAELEQRKQAIDLLVKPLGESLGHFQQKLGEIENKRERAYGQMETLLAAMKTTTENLNSGTNQLVSALKTSHVRGKYGEISLRRVVEVAGLSPYCDFSEQVSVSTDDGRLRPDMTIQLPGHRHLIVDSKVPLAAYMRAFATDIEDERVLHMRGHAAAVREHLKQLSHKSYWEQFPEAPDFVIMYLQVESSYGAALMIDPTLIEDGINKQIVMATPSTLITMLRTIGFMWQQERMAASIYEMRDAGLELYKRTTTMLNHFTKVGANLNSAVNSYNNAVGSVETRVIPQLEKIKDIGGTLAKDDIPDIKHVETNIRPIVRSLDTHENDVEIIKEHFE